jgi:hypothetical protein
MNTLLGQSVVWLYSNFINFNDTTAIVESSKEPILHTQKFNKIIG